METPGLWPGYALDVHDERLILTYCGEVLSDRAKVSEEAEKLLRMAARRHRGALAKAGEIRTSRECYRSTIERERGRLLNECRDYIKEAEAV